MEFWFKLLMVVNHNLICHLPFFICAHKQRLSVRICFRPLYIGLKVVFVSTMILLLKINSDPSANLIGIPYCIHYIMDVLGISHIMDRDIPFFQPIVKLMIRSITDS